MSDSVLIVFLVAWFALFVVGCLLLGDVVSGALEVRWRRRLGLPPRDDRVK